MSKSRRNTVDPTASIAAYGADTARLFMLSDSPPERDLEWTEAGIDGAWRYLNRLWRLFEERLPQLAPPGTPTPDRLSPAATELKRAIHQTIDAVSQELERFHFNKAVALIRELSNRVEAVRCRRSGGAGVAARGARDPGPAARARWCRTSPRSCGSALATTTLLADAAWPQADPAWLARIG